MTKSFFIETYGCQMNRYDSELMAGILSSDGYREANKLDEADIVLVNTCSVRDHAECRVLGRLGQLKHLKCRNPNLIIGLCGCMAQRLGKEISKRAAHVDLVIGPDEYRQLPELISRLDDYPAYEITLNSMETYTDVIPERHQESKAWIAIMRGCDNFCSYCIVPYVRGSARSRPVIDIVNEVVTVVRNGYKEITLLGQNVNAYLSDGTGFAELLEKLNGLHDLERIRFTTSHPKDMTRKMIDVIAAGDKICEHIHLPLQSGSNRILLAMNRQYTAEDYLQLVSTIRKTIPDGSLTTDILVGFPGETEDDYQKTLEIVDTVGFDSAFTFRYSPRPGTKAAELKDDVPERVKIERLERLIALQRSITDKKNRELVGKEFEVLVEGESRKGRGQLVGRTRTDKTVVFDGDTALTASCRRVKVQAAKGWTLKGKLVESNCGNI